MPVFRIDKPLGPTSHDVVAVARRRLGTRKVGHAGTLDPLATGLLILLADDATKLSPFLGGEDKAYLAWVAFGAATPTLDAEGPVASEGDASHVDAGAVRYALPGFLAVTEQRPPAFSAVKRGGEKGYEAARRGRDPDLPPRPAGYRTVELLAFAPHRADLPAAFAPDRGAWGPAPEGRGFALPPPLGAHPTALVRLQVASGTYIRAFARDLGEALGVPSHLAGLARTRIGAHDLADAVAPDALPDAPTVPMAEALPYPVQRLDAASAARVRLGQRLALPLEGRTSLVGPDGELVAVADAEDGRMRLLRVWT